ncbi:TPA: transcriptional regulator [Legionella pneumophila]|nr:transcriptional regulator [Legionella pneumophila]HAT2138284.1 transcriptional regulator [Legionella pneumophila]HAT8774234.1 transcriptional regulator [Legionella pneumophila]HAU0824552.1 transcriptional regulator [Legionella pneumophila]HAU2193254.1 transcriptional regulator [Legionella pneumophila]
MPGIPIEGYYLLDGYLRAKQILGDPSAIPPMPPIIPVSKSTWWDGVKSGRFPKPIKPSPGITLWKVEDIRKLIENGF